MTQTHRLNAERTRAITGQIIRSGSTLADNRQLRAMISNEEMGRDGLVVASDGLDTKNYSRNPVVLFGHDDTRPIARASVSRSGSSVMATLQFPPQGVCDDSDRCLALAQSGVLSGISIGFRALESRPIPGGRKVTKSELLEISLCAIPSLQSALVTERSLRFAGDRTTAEGRRLAAWQRRAALPLSPNGATSVDERRRAAAAKRRKLVAARDWLHP
jgi:HK97 family phage prohead protease